MFTVISNLRIGFLVLGTLAAGFSVAALDGLLPEDVSVKGGPAQVLSPYVLIQPAPGTDVSIEAASLGLRYVKTVDSNRPWLQFRAADADAAAWAVAALRGLGDVAWVWQNRYCFLQPHGFSPNDPYYLPVSTFAGQWHLNNSVNPDWDLNVTPAWARDITGVGVTIGVVDDSVQGSHPDLAPNYLAGQSYDFLSRDTDPSPEGTDKHGVSVSGCAAARGGNGLGVTGVAPFANLAGLRIGFNSATVDTDLFDAARYNSIGSSPTIHVKNHSYGYSAPYIDDTVAKQGVEDSAAAGTIHCFSAGNSRGTSAQDANKQHMLTSPNVIAVAAMANTGKNASYSSFGANVFCTAPSSGGSAGITTTDRVGTGVGYDGFVNDDYTAGFGGTSAASPEVAGAMALLRQVRPSANVRFAKHMLARSCKVVDPSDSQASADGGWRANAAGLKFNPDYGFGLVDVDALTLLAAQYTGVSSPNSWQSATVNVGLTIPDNSATGLVQTFQVPINLTVETVEVHIEATHPGRGNLETVLTSPSGLAVKVGRNSTSDLSPNLNWTYLANAFWGEQGKGTWSVEVRDRASTRVGTWDKVWIRVNFGAPIANQQTTGTVTLGQFSGQPSQQPATLTLQEPGTNNIIAVLIALLADDGTFVASGEAPDGTFDVSLKASHWLSRRINNVSFTRGASGLAFGTLPNGDCDDDNVVSLFDYLILSNAFDAVPGDTNWDARADLDGDAVVSLFDYIILSDNFDMQGQ